MKAALLQLNSSDEPKKNLDTTLALVDSALAQGAELREGAINQSKRRI